MNKGINIYNFSSIDEQIQTLLYINPLKEEPSRNQMITYAGWRISLYQQLQAMSTDALKNLNTQLGWVEKHPQLCRLTQQKQYYMDLITYIKKQKTLKQDIISHFVSRMLYCHDQKNHSKFIQIQRNILNLRLKNILGDNQLYKTKYIYYLKSIIAYFINVSIQSLNVDQKEWNKYSHKITHKKNQSIQDYIVVPLEFGQVGLRKRYAFVFKAKVYLDIYGSTQLVLDLYSNFLREKLQKMRGPVCDMINHDIQNQLGSFLKNTLETLNNTNLNQKIITGDFKLTMKNIDSLWKKYYPPCMLQLTQRLKQVNHLKHQGRRQLWLFLRGCGMQCSDNMQYFRRHLAAKVSASDLKSHMYNIQHAYGLVGKKQPQRPKNCRNIISGPAPKKDQFHGCPFAHWRSQHLAQYIRKNYNISEANIQQILKQQNQKHFQVACGRLFEGVAKQQGISQLPPDVANLLGQSPHQYFHANMELVFKISQKGNSNVKPTNKQLQF